LYGRYPLESRGARERELYSEIRRRGGSAYIGENSDLLPLWREPGLTQAEEEGLAEWRLAGRAGVLSAVMARIDLLSAYNASPELNINPHTGNPRLSWRGGVSLSRFAVLTGKGALKVIGAQITHTGHNSCLLSRDDAVMELRGPVTEDSARPRIREATDRMPGAEAGDAGGARQ
jgi:hypothetical protein